jgi:hypothetical protein
MCRNITPLRGLEPPATGEEVEAAALQYVRKVGALSSVSAANAEAVQRAVARVAAATEDLLVELGPRRSPPKVQPPLRRRSAPSTPVPQRGSGPSSRATRASQAASAAPSTSSG